LEDEEGVPSPAARVKPPMVPEDKLVPVLGPDELRRLLEACAGKGFEARRDTALIMFLLDTGVRRAGILRLKGRDALGGPALVLAWPAGQESAYVPEPGRSATAPHGRLDVLGRPSGCAAAACRETATPIPERIPIDP
jgi:integrase